MAGFDLIASVYSQLSQLVFGKSLLNAQAHFVSIIRENTSILIIGGGNGEILESLERTGKKLDITYVEKSSKMIRYAKMRNVSRTLTIDYITADIFDMTGEEKFDVIITSFFLDCFNSETLSKELPGIRNKLHSEGTWLFTDFMDTPSRIHRFLTWFMYCFFRLSTGLEARKIPDYDHHFREIGLRIDQQANWLNGYVESRVYRPE